MNRWIRAGIAVAALLPLTAQVPQGEASAATSQQGMFYYPWYPENWGSTNFPQSHYSFPGTRPTGGYYSTVDAIPRHVDDFVTAGMEFGVSSWYRCGNSGGDTACGTNRSIRDVRFEQLLNEAQLDGRGLAFAPYYELEGFADPTIEVIQQDLRYLTEHYVNHPNYLKSCEADGECYPVIFVYAGGKGPEADPCGNPSDGTFTGMVERWVNADTESTGPASVSVEPRATFHIVLKVFAGSPGWRQCRIDQNLNPNLISWHQYGPSTAVQTHLPYSKAISPGFWHWSSGTPKLARLSDTTWRSNIQAMVDSGAKWQLVTTYNEWQEGTGVEPALEFNPGDLYLDALHDVLVGPPG